MAIGIRSFFRKSADQAVAASATLVDATDLSVPIAAGQTLKIGIYAPFTVGATGGFKFQVVVPAAGTSFLQSYVVTDGVTASPGAIISASITASASFANALAVAGTHMLQSEVEVVNGATAGDVKLQFACNSAANGITLLKGSYFDVIAL